jgi:hypothetical protein
MNAILAEVRRVVADPRVVARIVAKTEDRIGAIIDNLACEHKATLSVLAGMQGNARVDHLERISQIKTRLEEIDQELGRLNRATLRDDVTSALLRFWPVWNSLHSRDRAGILLSLIERVVYDGSTTKRLVIKLRGSACGNQ